MTHQHKMSRIVRRLIPSWAPFYVERIVGKRTIYLKKIYHNFFIFIYMWKLVSPLESAWKVQSEKRLNPKSIFGTLRLISCWCITYFNLCHWKTQKETAMENEKRKAGKNSDCLFLFPPSTTNEHATHLFQKSCNMCNLYFD